MLIMPPAKTPPNPRNVDPVRDPGGILPSSTDILLYASVTLTISDMIKKGVRDNWRVRAVYIDLRHPCWFPCRITIATNSVWKIETDDKIQRKMISVHLKC